MDMVVIVEGLLPGGPNLCARSARSGLIPGTTEKQLGGQGATGHRHHGRSGPHLAAQTGHHRLQGGWRHRVGPADRHQVGNLQLLVEQLFQGREMLQARIRQPLPLHRRPVPHHMAGSQGLPIHHGDDRMHPGAGAHRGPLKRRNQGLWQGQPAGLHHQAVQLVGPLQQAFHRRQKVVLHGAAQATVGEFHKPTFQLLFRAEATVGEEVGIDPDIAELIDDDGQPLAAVQEQMAQQRGLARAQKARHQRDRQTG